MSLHNGEKALARHTTANPAYMIMLIPQRIQCFHSVSKFCTKYEFGNTEIVVFYNTEYRTDCKNT